VPCASASPSQPILNVTGVRWQESFRRSKMPIAASMPQLERKATKALAWNAIIDWPLPEVLSIARQAGIAPHIARYMELPASVAPTASCPRPRTCSLRPHNRVYCCRAHGRPH
jgi:hypothetical protein